MSTMDAMFQGQSAAIDPVCKMTVDKANPPGGTAEHESQVYYFCAVGCREAFTAEPAKFL